ncbi:MAG: class I SAM-dependent methyltransferase [Deltaproteobacteria bacterium]|nr:class I SAM-dependent methyltransferase [Deltaproteobacteria bacterium]
MKGLLSESPYWEEMYRERRWAKYLPDQRKYRGHYEFDRIFRTVLQPDTSKKLLELGAGGSIWLPYFAQEFGFEVYGIDYTEKGCELAERNLALAGVKGEIRCEDFFKAINYWRGFFDVVVSFGVVEHFNHPVEIIRLMKNLLKRDGMSITVVPNTAGSLFRLQRFIDKDVYEIHKVFSLKDLSSYHTEINMQVVVERYMQFMDLITLNYQRIFKGRSHKWVAQGITGLNLPILYLQKAFRFFPQSKRWCSFMVVAAKRKTEPKNGR